MVTQQHKLNWKQLWVTELLVTLQVSHHTFLGLHNWLLHLFSACQPFHAWGHFSMEYFTTCTHSQNHTLAFMFCLNLCSHSTRVTVLSARQIKANCQAHNKSWDKSYQDYTSKSLSKGSGHMPCMLVWVLQKRWNSELRQDLCVYTSRTKCTLLEEGKSMLNVIQRCKRTDYIKQ